MLVAFLTQGRNVPSSRFRVQQFLPHLRSSGIKCLHLPSLPAQTYSPQTRYRQLNRLLFLLFIVIKTLVRLAQLPIIASADVVIIQKEVLPRSFLHLERLIRAVNRRIIFDFDDAIFLPPSGEVSSLMSKVLAQKRVDQTLSMAKTVFAGNSYLAAYAKKHNDRVVLIPTAVDTDLYTPATPPAEKVVIGWIGTASNLKNLHSLVDVFRAIGQNHPSATLKIVSNKEPVFLNELSNVIPTELVYWSKSEEIKQLQSFNIGLMPLEDTPRNRGKCGFKLLQYMAVGVVCIGSPVGVNREIIDHGSDGYLASTNEEWLKYLEELITSPQKRSAFGRAGRQKVEERYSVKAVLPKIVKEIAILSTLRESR